MDRVLPRWFYLLVAVVLPACSPSSCQRQEPRALFPADSLSREIAAKAPVDSLELRARSRGSGTHVLEHPRTLVVLEGGGIVVGDTRRGTLFTFGRDGRFISESTKLFEYPYLAGSQADTLAVFDPGSNRLSRIHDGRIVDSCRVGSGDRTALRYVTATSTGAFIKIVPREGRKRLVRLDRSCRPIAETPISGSEWRVAGLLRTSGDTLISLSGYRPLVDRWIPPARPDSVYLSGFDSPMLARSRAFALGAIQEAPLMIPSATVFEGRYYVLNARPGWLRVDVYNQKGTLERVLTSANPKFNRKYFPLDIAVFRDPEGALVLAVITSEDDPSLEIWTVR